MNTGEKFLVVLGITGIIATVWFGGIFYGEKIGIQKTRDAAVKSGAGQYCINRRI